jgi:hypothetical protein
MRNVTVKSCSGKTHFMINNFFSKIVSFMRMWKNMVQRCRPQMTIQYRVWAVHGGKYAYRHTLRKCVNCHTVCSSVLQRSMAAVSSTKLHGVTSHCLLYRSHDLQSVLRAPVLLGWICATLRAPKRHPGRGEDANRMARYLCKLICTISFSPFKNTHWHLFTWHIHLATSSNDKRFSCERWTDFFWCCHGQTCWFAGGYHTLNN